MQFVTNGPDIPNILLQAHEEGRVVFFCGAGISYPAGLPSFKGLVDKIYKNLDAQQTETATEAKAYKNWQFDTTLNLLELRYPGGRLVVRKALAQALKPNLKKKGAADTHAALLELASSRDGSLRLVTTNFDRIFNHLISRNKLPITEYAAPHLPIPKNSSWNGLVYLHGLLPKKPEPSELNRLVITSGDFGLAYLVERWAARFVSELFRNYVVCFVGYSIEDPVLRYMMDALAADRMLGEITPQAYALGGCKPNEEAAMKVGWEAKGVIPILYEVPIGTHDHSALHKTLKLWAEIYRDGIQGKERIVVDYAQISPQASTQQDNYVGRMRWALSDPSGLPAKRFANLDPVPSLEWLKPLSEDCFSQVDLLQFGISSPHKTDKNLQFSLLCRPASYQHTPWMGITLKTAGGSNWDDIMGSFAHWLLRHLNDPQLLLWLTQNSSQLQNQLVRMIEWKLDEFAKLEREGNANELERIRANAPNAIPLPPMRILWRLLLSGRVKTSPGDSDDFRFYSWEKRLKRDGFTTMLRFEFRELLAPKIKLRKRIPSLWDGDNEVETTFTSIKKLVDWDLVLTADHLHYSIANLKKLEDWPKILTELFVEIQQLIRDALDLQNELGVDGLHDRSNWDLPSISPHWQNRRFREWVLLIELLRDAWLEIKQANPDRATKIAKDWFEQPYLTFKRLALFAASHDGCICPDEWVSWLLVDNCWWLWSSDTKRETMRLLVLQGQYLTPAAQDQLEISILARRENSNSEHSIWLRLAKLDSIGCVLGNDASQKLADLSEANPDWKIAEDEKDEFFTWMSGTGDPGYEEQNPMLLIPRTLDDLVSWLKKERDGMLFSENDWSDVCQREFATVLRAFCVLSKDNIWPSYYWLNALQTWSDEKRVRHCWRYVAPLVSQMPDEVLLELAPSLAWWLNAVSKKKLNCHAKIFFDLCDRYLDLEHRISDLENLTIDHAINHPIGHITNALINVWFLREPSDDDCLPDDLKPFFTRLCGMERNQYRYGRIILSWHLISFFRVDREWTKQYLLPIMNWQQSKSEARSAWTGFLHSPRLYWPLLTAIKNDFLETAKHYDSLGDTFGRQYVMLLVHAALDPTRVFESTEFRLAIEALSQEGLQRAAGALANALNGAGKQREQYWQNCIEPFWKNIWPKNNRNISKPMTEELVRLSIAAGDKFPEALKTVLNWLQPLEDPHHILHLLEESKLGSRFPEDALSLLKKVTGDSLWSHDALGRCLDEIANAWQQCQQDPHYRRLRVLTDNR